MWQFSIENISKTFHLWWNCTKKRGHNSICTSINLKVNLLSTYVLFLCGSNVRFRRDVLSKIVMFANFHTSVKPQRVPECNCFDRSRATKVLVPMSVIFALNQRIRIFFNKMKYITIHNITSQGTLSLDHYWIFRLCMCISVLSINIHMPINAMVIKIRITLIFNDA